MNKKTTISAIFIEGQEIPMKGRQMLPSLSDLKNKVVEINKNTLSQSLSEIIDEMDEVLAKAIEEKTTGKVQLKEVSIAVQININGGIQWIANINSGITNSMTLTFKLKD